MNKLRVYRASTDPRIHPIIRGRWYASAGRSPVVSADTWEDTLSQLAEQHTTPTPVGLSGEWAKRQAVFTAAVQTSGPRVDVHRRYNPNTKLFDGNE